MLRQNQAIDMQITVLGSSSSGNGYVIQNGEEAIILEAGIAISAVKKALGYNIKKVNGCFISHAHIDHCKHIAYYEKVFPLWANAHTIEAKKLTRTKTAEPGKGIRAGRWKVLPFRAYHDIPCLGYFINHPEIGNLLFLTDSFMVDSTFKNVNHLLIECNYSDEALLKAIEAGYTHPSMRRRLMTTHMELKTAAKLINDNDLSQVYTILLLHLSSHNSDTNQFIDALARASGKEITIAKPGLTIELINNPY